MPKRKRTRAQERQEQVNQARMINEERIADEACRIHREAEMARAAAEYDDPPPF
ncbi:MULTISPECIES: hypothetical protein [unclassified Mycolicibacterium]|uniref:hypothetical protein n=1 Tax=unclassified Mycolicibacterium TaxID=2636767 RepID=UPI0012DD4BA6|nr:MULTISPECIES: hypothetical protein [unclassified Mycolicibacterium]